MLFPDLEARGQEAKVLPIDGDAPKAPNVGSVCVCVCVTNNRKNEGAEEKYMIALSRPCDERRRMGVVSHPAILRRPVGQDCV